MAGDSPLQPLPPGGCSATPRVARLLLDQHGRPGVQTIWIPSAGLQLQSIAEAPGQPDLCVGHVISVIGSSSLAEAKTEEEAMKSLADECDAANAQLKRGISCVISTAVAKPIAAIAPATLAPTVSGRARLYKVWPAGNRFFCGGYCMTGHPGHECSTSGCIREACGGSKFCHRMADITEGCDSINQPVCTSLGPANLFAWVCILVPCSLYFSLALPYYWSEVHPLLPMAALFFFLMTVGCLLGACLADPGIIPRREVILATGAAERLQQELGYNVLGEAVQGYDGEGERILIPPELKSQGYRWCTTCRIIRPPRASHCSDCDNCVLRFDHHCPFVNNCVGQRNYLFFFGFTSSVCLLAMVVIPSLLWYLLVGTGLGPAQGQRTNGYEVNSDSVMRGFLITLAAAAGTGAVCVIGLWSYHLFLICSGLTTREHIKGIRTKEIIPGLSEDSTTCSRRGPSLISTRAVVGTIPGPLGRRWRLPDPGRVTLQV